MKTRTLSRSEEHALADEARTADLHAKPQQILDRLLADHPAPTSRWDLVDMLKPGLNPEQTVRVHINTIRHHIGYDTIKSVWGYGYQLTERGRQIVTARAA